LSSTKFFIWKSYEIFWLTIYISGPLENGFIIYFRTREIKRIWMQQHCTPSRLLNEAFFDSDLISKTQLWLPLFIKILLKSDIWIFYEAFFKTNLVIWFSYFQTQQLKNYSWFIYLTLDSSLVQNYFFSNLEGVIIIKIVLGRNVSGHCKTRLLISFKRHKLKLPHAYPGIHTIIGVYTYTTRKHK
jgi:hypothetical protein